MKTIRDFTARMHSLRLTVVRRSSSIRPILIVLRGKPEQLLDRGEQVVGECDLVRPVHLRLDDVDRAGAAVARTVAALEIVQRDQAGDHARRARLPAPDVRRGRARRRSVIRWPTLRTSIRLRPGSVSVPPSGAVKLRSAASLRVTGLPPFWNVSTSVARHQPEPVAVGRDLVDGSTAAIESSRSMMVVSAASSTTSATPAASSRPTGWLRSITNLDVQAVVDAAGSPPARPAGRDSRELLAVRQSNDGAVVEPALQARRP